MLLHVRDVRKHVPPEIRRARHICIPDGIPRRTDSCARKCVRPIARASAASAVWCYGQSEHRSHHERDLIFRRAAATDSGLFDARRRVFENWKTAFRCGENRRATRCTQQNRRLVTLHVNDRFKRTTIRFVFTN